jgi:hypothetical protein
MHIHSHGPSNLTFRINFSLSAPLCTPRTGARDSRRRDLKALTLRPYYPYDVCLNEGTSPYSQTIPNTYEVVNVGT